jgi:hypothetical protein
LTYLCCTSSVQEYNTHRLRYQLIAQFSYLLYKTPTYFGPEEGLDIWPKYVGVLYNNYKNTRLVGSEMFVILLAGFEIRFLSLCQWPELNPE